TSETPSPELAKYTEEINESLKDNHKTSSRSSLISRKIWRNERPTLQLFEGFQKNQ
ncbi:2478_t:CDS:2, partial [Funneliformis geosporum]